MKNYRIVSIDEAAAMKEEAAAWFSEKWDVPREAYAESMEECICRKGAVPRWYLVLDSDEKIIGGAGIIENDFHERRDLSPNLCALYVEEEHRGRGIAGRLLERACEDMADRGVDRLYLITEHDSFYERYGFSFLHTVRDDEGGLMRMYGKKTKTDSSEKGFR